MYASTIAVAWLHKQICHASEAQHPWGHGKAQGWFRATVPWWQNADDMAEDKMGRVIRIKGATM
jgi:hypothetical protein